MKANRKCPVLPLLLTGIVAVFSLYGCSATRGVEKVSCHIEYDTAVTAEELNMDVENPIWTARGPRGYLRDTEEVTDIIRDDVNLICRYVFYWKKRLAKVYVYTWMEEGTPLIYPVPVLGLSRLTGRVQSRGVHDLSRLIDKAQDLLL